MPTFRFDKAFGIARDIRARVQFRQARSQIEAKRREAEQARNDFRKLKTELKSKKQDLEQIRKERHTVEDKERRSEYGDRAKKVQQEISQLQRELRVAKERQGGGAPVTRSAPRVVGEAETGALPDFVIIGARKCGTTFLYHLLTQHPHIEPAALKEVHFFDALYEEGVEWYRQNFPTPRWKDGRTTITGEASPHIAYPLAPERVAEVVPRARLIALLRNPVDRAYSRYQQMVRRGRITRSFEEVVEREKAMLLKAPQSGEDREEYLAEVRESSEDWIQALYKGLYVEHLARWSEFFDREQMLILKSEDFFTRPQEILQQVFGFLDLPEWEPDPSEFERKRNARKYEKMNPETRRSLEEFFEPHNKRLYEYLGRDLGW